MTDDVYQNAYLGEVVRHGPELGLAHDKPTSASDAPIYKVPAKQPIAWARAFLRSSFHHPDRYTLARWRGQWFAYQDGTWATVSDEAIRADAYCWAEFASLIDDKTGYDYPFNADNQKISKLLDAARARVFIRDGQQMPGLIGPIEIDPVNSLTMANGILDLVGRNLLPHTPFLFDTGRVNFNFDRGAPPPQTWLRFLDQLWPDDGDVTRLLQELIGYCLTSDTALQKAFLFVGSKRSGKGTIFRIIQHLIGMNAVAAWKKDSLSDKFGLESIIGKKVAVNPDLRLGPQTDLETFAERILSITGEDLQTVDRKFLPAWTGRLFTRFLIGSNQMPEVRDASGALQSRFIILKFTKDFSGREDLNLERKLVRELPGILNWALDGLQRLRANGRFTSTRSSSEASEDFRRSGSTAMAFIDDRTELDPRASASCADMFAAWRSWCVEGNYPPGTATSFGHHLRAAAPSITVVKRQVAGERRNYYQGVRLRCP